VTESAPLVLASASLRRRELLAALGVPFTVLAADVDERFLAGESPADTALRLALRKAGAISVASAGALVLAADTVVALDDRIFAKPNDAAEARAMLRALRGRTHTVITGVALRDAATGRTLTAAPARAVTMRDYTDAEIAASIAAGTPFDKAGGYAIQDEAFAPVAALTGCYCNVVGLPLWTVREMLAEVRPRLATVPPSERRPVCATCPLASLVPYPRVP
jgi:MAF protein